MSHDDAPTGDLPTIPSSGGTHARRIDDYQLLQKIGEGGMGEVWLAEQERPVRRRVALKLIKHGLATAEVLARFETERQALAMMDHPTIAKVFDAGTAPDGRPYFVMEWVEGIPITDHCDRHRLGIRERLGLFTQVCEGLQHAHQKAIIHRDIKPSNILVAIRDAQAVPKIIDFGVAKATTQRLTERTLFTEVGAMIGTPAYMSPEQADLTTQDVDTRTDVYSLGAVLYELLTGQPPFDPRELRRIGFDELRRTIREVEPPRPSARASTVAGARAQGAGAPRGAADSADPSASRTTETAGLAGQLRGDLDWITMKALDKDRTRRYGSATEFAADVQRYLRHEPISARPPSAAYRIGKFVRRHRVGVGVATAAVVGLCAFAVVTTLQARRITRERDRANQEADAAREVTDFLVKLFRVSDPGEARGRSVTAREILEQAAERVRTEMSTQPKLQARLMQVIGQVYVNLGLYRAASPLLEESLALNRRLLGPEANETLQGETALAWLMGNDGRGAQAESLAETSIERMKRTLGPDDRTTLSAMNNLAVLYTYSKNYAASESLRLVTLDAQRRVLGSDNIEVLRSQNNLGMLYSETGRPAKAESLFLLTADAQRRTLGDDHVETIRTLSNLVLVYGNQRRLALAESLRVSTLAAYGRVLGDEHPETLRAKANLGNLCVATGRLADAKRIFEEVIGARERVLGENHPATLVAKRLLGSVYRQQGRLASADSLLSRVLAGQTTNEGDASRDALSTRGELVLVRYSLKRPDAFPLAEKLVDDFTRTLGKNASTTLAWNYNTACMALGTGQRAKAIEYLRRGADNGLQSPGIREDSDLAPLHGDPEFEEIAARIGGTAAPHDSTAGTH